MSNRTCSLLPWQHVLLLVQVEEQQMKAEDLLELLSDHVLPDGTHGSNSLPDLLLFLFANCSLNCSLDRFPDQHSPLRPWST